MTDNELIAKFMGGHQNTEGRWYNVKPIQNGKNGYLLTQNFKYDISWDWLIPFVDKLNNTLYDYKEQFGVIPLMNEGYSDLDDVPVTSGIITVYETAVNLLKWYNAQPK